IANTPLSLHDALPNYGISSQGKAPQKTQRDNSGNLGSQLVDAVRKGNKRTNVSDIAKEITRKKQKDETFNTDSSQPLADGIENPDRKSTRLNSSHVSI